VKIWPLYKFTESMKKHSLNAVRVAEVIITYYVFAHVLACIYATLPIRSSNVGETWVRRLPVPEGGSTSLDNISNKSLYVSALYFVVGSISHVAIGDISSVTSEERVLNALLFLISTFVYAVLFGNMTALIADFAPSIFFNFHENYQFVMSRLPLSRIPEKTVADINSFYDNLWSIAKGFQFD